MKRTKDDRASKVIANQLTYFNPNSSSLEDDKQADIGQLKEEVDQIRNIMNQLRFSRASSSSQPVLKPSENSSIADSHQGLSPLIGRGIGRSTAQKDPSQFTGGVSPLNKSHFTQ